MTMADNIAVAFRSLRKQGFVARQNFCCCQGCALSKLLQEAHGAEDAPTGYCFFTKQDRKRLDAEGRVLLAFGIFPSEKKSSTAGEVGKLIVATCETAGCAVDWSGSTSEKILVWRDENTRRAFIARRLGAKIED